ncbi:MAG: AAA family ATPase [Bacteriovorax sp.]|nr:AAA family ATPase [Bacteriovorax sp.]
MYKRALDLKTALKEKSHFLFGPRATGKSSLVKEQLKKAQVFDLLDSDIYDRFLRRPKSLSEEIDNDLVVIDEIQKLPRLLDEVHRLIETKKIKFLLAGSSARKLKNGGANLLAGRARSLQMHPLAMKEITDFDLLKYLTVGGLPIIYQSKKPQLELKEYVQTYLKEEVQAEALVRNIDHFARFLDSFGALSGQELNYQKIADDAGVPVRTVASYVEILKDTLVAFELTPFTKTVKRKSVSKSKIFMFDVGISNFMKGVSTLSPKSEAFGDAFEHFCLQEIRTAISYKEKLMSMNYWRSTSGDFEVDCILGKEMAIEIKSSDRFQEKHLKGLKAFKEEGLVKRHILISRDPIKRLVDGIEVMPYEQFFKEFWK